MLSITPDTLQRLRSMLMKSAMCMQGAERMQQVDDAEPQVDVLLTSESAGSRGRSTCSADDDVREQLSRCRQQLEQLHQVRALS